MSRFVSVLLLTGLLAATSACNILGPRGVENGSPGSPEGLLDVSSEVVNLGVRSGKEVDDLSQWVNRDQPTRAELYCQEGEKNCREAQQVLDLYGVPVTKVPSPAGTVTLVYERVLARDCDPSYRDDVNLWYNEHLQGFGCAMSANIVQHVTQKQQFISPNLSDYRDAEAAVNGYTRYSSSTNKSTEQNAGQYTLGNSLLNSAKSQ